MRLSNNEWVFEGKAYSRAGFLDAFTNKLDEIRNLNFKEYVSKVNKRFSNSSNYKLTVTENTKTIITNDLDLINQDLKKINCFN